MISFTRAMLRRARYCHSPQYSVCLSDCLSVSDCLWRSGTGTGFT